MSIFQKNHSHERHTEHTSTRFFTGLVLGVCGVGMAMVALLFLSSFAKSSSSTSVAAEINTGEKQNGAAPSDFEKKPAPKMSIEDRYQEALQKSSDIHGIYMTADVANDGGVPATRLRNHLIQIATSTEINAIVIDVKEVCGPEYNAEKIKQLVQTLHENNLWAIARIASFKDASQIEAHPDWYLWRNTAIATKDNCLYKHSLRAPKGSTTAEHPLWRDNTGGYWLDPAHPEVRQYLVDIGKKMIDLGFDELQFDYMRFPSDGDVKNAHYPAWDGQSQKYQVLKSFFQDLHDNLRAYRPDIVLSADLFGNVATVGQDIGIGQRLEDLGDAFDYLSFMVYPSHYYGGFAVPTDAEHKLPAVSMNLDQARRHPDVVIARSLIIARDFLDGQNPWRIIGNTKASSTASTTPTSPLKARSKARIRPWLEDFFHESDQAAGRPYGSQKVRMQIDAAETTENHGWLLWDAGNVYTEGALKPK